MGRDPRHLPRAGGLVEITQRTFQGRYLLRPSKRLNALMVGCLAKAQENTKIPLHGVISMSSHFHVLCSPESVEQMAAFMGQFKTSLSIEIGHLHDWPGASFGHRYHHIPVSDEPEAQESRLDYLLRHGCKEGLVHSPREWPGVHSVEALIKGQALEGTWIDRTSFHHARSRGEDVHLHDFEQSLELKLEPLPCWTGESEPAWRQKVARMVEMIEKETSERHRLGGTLPAGADAVLGAHPHQLGRELWKSPRPRFHARAKAVRAALLEGFRQFLIAYRRAAERLAAGEVRVRFPENCFPPRLPYLPPSPPSPG